MFTRKLPIPQSKFEEIVEEAKLAFWAKIAEHFPEIREDNSSMGRFDDLEMTMNNAVGLWLDTNYPTLKEIKLRQMEDLLMAGYSDLVHEPNTYPSDMWTMIQELRRIDDDDEPTAQDSAFKFVTKYPED